MASQHTLHILDKKNYSKHRLVTLPSDPLPPLAPSSIRIQSKTLGLTTNNLTYAQLGHIMGWWDCHPQPTNTPTPYNDRSAYGRTSAWGYAEIIESTVPEIPAGNTVYGYIAIGTDPIDVTIEQTGLKDQIFATAPHRQALWKIYNRYRVGPPFDELIKTKGLEYLGWDSFWGLFATSYNLNAYGFAWEEKKRIHPQGQGEWTAEDANLDDAAVVLLSASGKTAMSFAHQLRNNRPKEHQPKSVIAVGSSASKEMTEKSGLYDEVLLYSDIEQAKDLLTKSNPRRIVLLDFGGRGDARKTWEAGLSQLPIPFLFVLVGSGTKSEDPEKATQGFARFAGTIVVNAGSLREKGIALGGDSYIDEFDRVYDELKTNGGLPGIKIKWGEGMEAVADGWEEFCRDKVPADTALVFRV
ncbi:hypothetical protein CC78DRAFT_531871 [Lojkania enalia]|uniref:Uncharacterized protein n=1 Tax=Lojkania enalia TaxID=147567 RepID=A0A9P4N4V8_9PLEO|nr:hypothetical protein CC78DRAFT_531871 [Didymosphaeria enalia]